MTERGPTTLTLVDDGVATSEEIVSRYTSETIVSVLDAKDAEFAVLCIGSPIEVRGIALRAEYARLDAAACRHLARLLIKKADALDGLSTRSADR